MKKHYGFTALLLTLLLVLAAQCGGAAPTQAPAQAPTKAPTEAQAEAPTTAPTEAMTEAATEAPTEAATETATEAATSEAMAGGAIKIAIMGPFTGDAASIGTEQLNFARLAVEDFNKKMGTNIELVEEDTQLDPAIATTVAQKLVADPEIFAVIGPSGSQEVEASAELFEGANLVHVSPSATRPTLTQAGYKTFFRVVPNDDVQGPTDAKFIIEHLQAKSVVVIDDQTSYSVSLSDLVEKTLTDGGVTVARESVTQKDSDFSALVTKIKAAGADVIFFPGQIATQGAQLWKQMQEQGVEATLMGGDGFNSPDLVADGANEGSYVSNFAPDIKGIPEAADVVKAYSDEYGEFGAFGPPTYVATQVILEAIDRATQAGDVTRESVLAEVVKTDIAKTILGTPMKFDANGDVEGAQFYIFEVEDGQFSLVADAVEAMEVPTGEATTEAAGEVAPSGPIKIAIMGPFTGDAASVGTEQLNFARLAVEDLNAKLGLNIELVEEDTQLDPAIATTVAQKLVADPEIFAVIGPSGSQEVEASAELFEGANLAHVSPSATRPTLTQAGYKTFFRVVPNDDVQGPTDVKFILEHLKAKSVVVIDDQTSYSVSLSDVVEKGLTDGGVTVARESVTQKDSDFSALVTKIKAAGADVIFFPGQIATQGAQLWKQMQEQGVQATLMGGDGFNSPDLVADGANEGSYISAFAPDIKGIPGAADVVKAYSDEYGEFGAFGPPTYVATQAIIEAIDRAAKSGEVTRESVLAEVAKTDISETILGTPIKFDANGDVEGAQFYIFEVEGGQFSLVTE